MSYVGSNQTGVHSYGAYNPLGFGAYRQGPPLPPMAIGDVNLPSMFLAAIIAIPIAYYLLIKK